MCFLLAFNFFGANTVYSVRACKILPLIMRIGTIMPNNIVTTPYFTFRKIIQMIWKRKDKPTKWKMDRNSNTFEGFFMIVKGICLYC